MNKDEKCAVCNGDLSEDDEIIYCPDCGFPMHRSCFLAEGKCPNEENHSDSNENSDSGKVNVRSDRFFEHDEGCEICGKPFKEGDEKVFCPECGTAMHRICYELTHKCPYENEHTSAPKRDRLFISPTAEDGNVCGRCGKSLDEEEETVYCPECGTPIHKSCWEREPSCPNSYRHAQGYDWNSDHEKKKTVRQENTRMSEKEIRMTYDNFYDMINEHPFRSQDSNEELTCYGVNQKELLYFLGINKLSTPRFFSLFMNMANTGRKISINISAWIFSPFYHFYRRMTGPALLLTLATFILMLPSLIIQLIYWRNGDMSLASIVPDSISITASYILAGVRIVLLLFNDYFYMRWSVSKILSIREKCKDMPEDEYYEALEHYGNPRMMYVLGGLSLMLFLVFILNIFLSNSGIY